MNVINVLEYDSLNLMIKLTGSIIYEIRQIKHGPCNIPFFVIAQTNVVRFVCRNAKPFKLP